jgi:polyisoprenoid-binding protein YceI
MTQWKIDTAHSEIGFRVKHLVVSTVSGTFDRFDARIEAASPDFSDMTVTFEADAASINTKNGQRDAHLKSPDFFDAANHPKLSFASTSVKRLSDHEFEVAGGLTIRGVTRPVTLEVVYNGTVTGFGGTTIAGFEIRGKVNRFDFGLQWSALTETGGVVVGSDVRFEIQAEFNRAAEAAQAA